MQLDCGTAECLWFPVTKGVIQECILSPPLFSIYTEGIMRHVAHNHINGKYEEPSIQWLRLKDFRYAVATALLTTTLKRLILFYSKVRISN